MADDVCVRRGGGEGTAGQTSNDNEHAINFTRVVTSKRPLTQQQPRLPILDVVTCKRTPGPLVRKLARLPVIGSKRTGVADWGDWPALLRAASACAHKRNAGGDVTRQEIGHTRPRQVDKRYKALQEADGNCGPRSKRSSPALTAKREWTFSC